MLFMKKNEVRSLSWWQVGGSKAKSLALKISKIFIVKDIAD